MFCYCFNIVIFVNTTIIKSKVKKGLTIYQGEVMTGKFSLPLILGASNLTCFIKMAAARTSDYNMFLELDPGIKLGLSGWLVSTLSSVMAATRQHCLVTTHMGENRRSKDGVENCRHCYHYHLRSRRWSVQSTGRNQNLLLMICTISSLNCSDKIPLVLKGGKNSRVPYLQFSKFLTKNYSANKQTMSYNCSHA